MMKFKAGRYYKCAKRMVVNEVPIEVGDVLFLYQDFVTFVTFLTRDGKEILFTKEALEQIKTAFEDIDIL